MINTTFQEFHLLNTNNAYHCIHSHTNQYCGDDLPMGEFLEINEFCCYRKSPGRGVGVFAIRDIPKDITILRDLDRTIPGKDARYLSESEIRNHLFVDRSKNKNDADHPDFHLVFGASSILNHSDNPNCDIRWCIFNEFPVVETYALKEISSGSELFIRYQDMDAYSLYTFV